ncbi:MAG: hypothetical protein HN368_04625 [Spirochaetales bacterium]|nr:hypothetical protein [Spirochaetales bacterium]
MGKSSIVMFALILLLLNNPVSADSAEGDYNWDHPSEVAVSNLEIAFTRLKYSRAKNQSVFVMGYFNDGWVLMFSLFELDAPLLNRWGMYALVAEPDGTSHWKSGSIDKRAVVISEDHLFFTDGAITIEDFGDRFILQCDFDGFVCDIIFTKYLDPWKPGTGREQYTKDGETFQHKAVFAPWASISGWIEVDGLSVNVNGQGYGEKTLFVNPLTRYQPYLHALRLYTHYSNPREESWHIGILEATLNKAYGSRVLPRIVLARDDEWIFTSREYEFIPQKTVEPDFSPYPYPAKFKLFAEKNGYTIDGVVREGVFFHFTDIFDSLPKWVKKILAAFFKRPVYYRYVAEFDGTITEPDGTVNQLKMSGPYEFVVVF